MQFISHYYYPVLLLLLFLGRAAKHVGSAKKPPGQVNSETKQEKMHVCSYENALTIPSNFDGFSGSNQYLYNTGELLLYCKNYFFLSTGVPFLFIFKRKGKGEFHGAVSSGGSVAKA